MSVAAHEVSVSIGGRTVLPPTSFEALPGSTTALVGASGSGKTTLLNTLGLLVHPSRGSVSVDAEDTTAWKDRQRRRFWRDKAAFVFQDYGLIDEESVAYNVVMSAPPFITRRALTMPGVQEALAKVGLHGRGADQVSTLSGGEKQRVGIARAIYKQARYIFVDEPTASLDRTNREIVTSLLRGEAERGAVVVIATHDESLATACDHQLRLDPESVPYNPRL